MLLTWNVNVARSHTMVCGGFYMVLCGRDDVEFKNLDFFKMNFFGIFLNPYGYV